jgi:hypothetical protein
VEYSPQWHYRRNEVAQEFLKHYARQVGCPYPLQFAYSDKIQNECEPDKKPPPYQLIIVGVETNGVRRASYLEMQMRASASIIYPIKDRGKYGDSLALTTWRSIWEVGTPSRPIALTLAASLPWQQDATSEINQMRSQNGEAFLKKNEVKKNAGGNTGVKQNLRNLFASDTESHASIAQARMNNAECIKKKVEALYPFAHALFSKLEHITDNSLTNEALSKRWKAKMEIELGRDGHIVHEPLTNRNDPPAYKRETTIQWLLSLGSNNITLSLDWRTFRSALSEEWARFVFNPISETDFPINNKSITEIANALRRTFDELRSLISDYVAKCEALRFIQAVLKIQKLNRPELDGGLTSCDHLQAPHAKLSSLELRGRCGHIICTQCKESFKVGQSCIEGCSSESCECEILHPSDIGTLDPKPPRKWPGKIGAIVQLVVSIPAKEQIIIFAQNRRFLQALELAFEPIPGLKYASAHGNDSRKVNRVLDEFKTLPHSEKGWKQILLLNLDESTAAGHNLAGVTHVIFAAPISTQEQDKYDALLKQARGRAHRPPQTKLVKIYQFVCLDTIEVNIYEKRNGGKKLARVNGNLELVDAQTAKNLGQDFAVDPRLLGEVLNDEEELQRQLGEETASEIGRSADDDDDSDDDSDDDGDDDEDDDEDDD